ncbi:hypothetical protein CEXT_136671 [Caerostris extrusa]|uniref:Uncharacterized protein n=1 Tax=Caerostris extrusa TaxID=172846 RepID=A0AAV4X6X9_CAEEX|nr:hypothetical protein CEXT_136671 [Caerostris extrusa]
MSNETVYLHMGRTPENDYSSLVLPKIVACPKFLHHPSLHNQAISKEHALVASPCPMRQFICIWAQPPKMITPLMSWYVLQFVYYSNDDELFKYEHSLSSRTRSNLHISGGILLFGNPRAIFPPWIGNCSYTSLKVGIYFPGVVQARAISLLSI